MSLRVMAFQKINSIPVTPSLIKVMRTKMSLVKLGMTCKIISIVITQTER